MSKDAVRGYVILAILLVAFSVAAFVAPFAQTTVFWIAYGFGAFAILFQLYLFKFPLAADRGAKSRFYGFPIARLGLYYLVAQLAASFIEMAYAESFPVRAAVIANLVLAAMAIAGSLPAIAAWGEDVQPDAGNVSAMDELKSMARMMVGLCPEGELKRAMQGVADALDRAPASPDAALEANIRNQLGDIQQKIVDGDMAGAKAMCEGLTDKLGRN